jgi:hypothetical protein
LVKSRPPEDAADDRHDQVADQRLDDLAERRADDDADREIDDVAPHREFLEFLKHVCSPSSVVRSRAAIRAKQKR